MRWLKRSKKSGIGDASVIAGIGSGKPSHWGLGFTQAILSCPPNCGLILAAKPEAQALRTDKERSDALAES